MLQVKSEKLLQDYKALCVKRDENRAAIEVAARSFAVNRNYNEALTAEFIAFVQKKEADGLTDGEQAKLAFLAEYVEEVAEEVEAAVEETAAVVDEVSTEA